MIDLRGRKIDEWAQRWTASLEAWDIQPNPDAVAWGKRRALRRLKRWQDEQLAAKQAELLENAPEWPQVDYMDVSSRMSVFMARTVPLMPDAEEIKIRDDAIEKRIARDEAIKCRFVLQDYARELLPDFRVSFCGLHKIPKKHYKILQDPETGKAHLEGVMRCGSVWVCPVCAAKISMGRRVELEAAFERAKEQGLKVLFVTLTSRHSRESSLTWSLKRSKAALRFMRKVRSWRNLRDDFGLVGVIDGLEITWGFAAGWHVHFHSAMLVSDHIDPHEAEEQIYELWSHALEHEDLDCDREHGIMVLEGYDKVTHYMTKWGLDSEITKADEKRGRGDNFTPFQLLELYAEGEGWAGHLYQEFADATKGVVSFSWSPRPNKRYGEIGLRARLDLGDDLSDQELAEAEQERGKQTELFIFTDEQFQKIKYSGKRGVIGDMLVIAERGREALLLWLWQCFQIEQECFKIGPEIEAG